MDITQDTEFSSELMEINKSSVDLRAKLDFMIKENSRLREKILELQNERRKRKGELQLKEPEAKKQKVTRFNLERIQQNVKEKISGYLVEINSLHCERRFLLRELASAQEKLKAIMYQQQRNQEEEEEKETSNETKEDKRSELKEAKRNFREVVRKFKSVTNKMNEHYKKQIDMADIMIRKYMNKTDFLEHSNKEKEGIIEQLSKRLNGIMAASFSQNRSGSTLALPKEFEDAYQSLDKKHQLLSEAYQILATKYESLAGELAKYLNLVNKDDKEVIRVLEDIIIEKENKLQLLTVENFKMKKECQNKDKVIGCCLKPHLEQAKLKDEGGVKIILYKAHKELKSIETKE